MKKIKWLFLFLSFVLLFSCENLLELERQNILSVEVPRDSVGFFRARVHGEVVDLINQNTQLIQHGHCWSTLPNPTIENDTTAFGVTELGVSFTSTLGKLNSGTTYYVRAYVSDSTETYYSNQAVFSTNPFASVDILSGTSTGNTAIIVSSIDLNGLPRIPNHGHVLSEEGKIPTLNDNLRITSLGVYREGDGTFVSSFEDLRAGSYVVRGYISNQQEQVIYSRAITIIIR